MNVILGISAFYHDSAAALLIDGEIVAACQEERLSRIKHDPGFPEQAIDYVLREAGLTLSEVDHVAFYDKPFLKFERILETHLSCVPFGLKSFTLSMPVWLKEKLFLKPMIIDYLRKKDPGFSEDKLIFGEHHYSHAASAFYPSPYDQALVLVMDGVGEWATATVSIGRGNQLKIVKEIRFPHSLGLMYSAFTYYCGFKVNSGEYKLMGLAPYGEPVYYEKIVKELIDIKADGSFRLNMKYFDYTVGDRMINRHFEQLFGMPARTAESETMGSFYMDVAASIQKVTEEIVLRITRSINSEYKINNICLAGGVALNCVANGKIQKEGRFDIWVQPASGDAGGAIGVALLAWYNFFNNSRVPCGEDSMHGAYLGPEFTDDVIELELKKNGAVYRRVDQDELIEITSDFLVNDAAVGWFQGRMEFGPRALGARSILADPRSESAQRNLNLKVKFRESFRPFAPSVLEEEAGNWFDLDSKSPYMLMVAQVKDEHCVVLTDGETPEKNISSINNIRSSIPAVTHVDYSARIQTVTEERNGIYCRLIKRFYEKTGVPMLVNTSFNVRGEPLVCSPADAYKCFMGTNLDILVCGSFILLKKDQDPKMFESYYGAYELD